jgi:hypothetical protein
VTSIRVVRRTETITSSVVRRTVTGFQPALVRRMVTVEHVPNCETGQKTCPFRLPESKQCWIAHSQSSIDPLSTSDLGRVLPWGSSENIPFPCTSESSTATPSPGAGRPTCAGVPIRTTSNSLLKWQYVPSQLFSRCVRSGDPVIRRPQYPYGKYLLWHLLSRKTEEPRDTPGTRLIRWTWN